MNVHLIWKWGHVLLSTAQLLAARTSETPSSIFTFGQILFGPIVISVSMDILHTV
jgi:hypothetical protein